MLLLLVFLPLNTSGELNNMNIITFRGDYFFHSMMFVPWAFFFRVFRLRTISWFLSGLVFAALCEAVQYPLPYRAWNINDMFANLFGILLGYMVYFLILKKNTSDGSHNF
jgi:glycopeptide antibiotics resistance protein